MNTDRLIVGSDSGKAVILEFDSAKRRFVKTHEETFGKTGCRRIVPGNYMLTQASTSHATLVAVPS